jgi:phage terminase large subunit-like protein
VLSFDGSYARDSTALCFATIADRPHVQLVKACERPRSDPHWRTPRGEVIDAVYAALERFDVVEFAPDPFGWLHEIEELELELGETCVVFPTNKPTLMGPAAKTFLEDAKDGLFTIDGTEPMTRHLGNCIGKSYRVGSEEFVVPVKAASDSPDKIDVAIAAIVAYVRAKHHALHPPVKRLPWTAV